MALEKASVVKAKGLLRADEVRAEIEQKARARQWHVEFHKRTDPRSRSRCCPGNSGKHRLEQVGGKSHL